MRIDKSYLNFVLALLCLAAISGCGQSKTDALPLVGKIAVSKPDNTFVIYNGGKINAEFRLRDDDQFSYSGLKWMHTIDNFVGIEYLRAENGRIRQGNVVRFDLGGKIIERIYESEEGELAGSAYSSWDDKRLLVTTERMGDNKDNPMQGLSRKQSVMVLDLKQKNVIKEIENLGSSPGLQIEESPWLPGGSRFVYSLTSGRKITNDRQIINPLSEGYAGVYVYDLITDQKKLLIAGAHFAIASSMGNQIAYIKDNSVRVLDLDTNDEKVVYELGPKHRVSNIHWTPDGKHIYIAYFYYHLGLSDLFTTRTRLIEVRGGDEVSFTRIKHGFHPNTWK